MNNRETIKNKIAYYISKKGEEQGYRYPQDYYWGMAEKLIIKYEYFMEEYGYITEIIKEINNEI